MELNRPISVVPVILCGGSGTRLWPLSRSGFPKQFLVLNGTTSLFQQAIDRVNSLGSEDIHVRDTLVVTGEEHRFLALDQLREMSSVSAHLILEPEGKNTAPALTLAALQALENEEDPVLIVSPADQAVKDLTSFIDVLHNSIRVAATGSVVVLGIKPTSPETGFGYIKQTNSKGEFGEVGVDAFVEKPDLIRAKEYLLSDDYFWNGGIFVLKASTWLKMLRHFRPDIEQATRQAFLESVKDFSFIRPSPILFKNVPSESIDYAVIEKCPLSEFSIKMMPLDVGWSDLGAWDAVWQIGDKDLNNNLISGNVFAVKTKNSLVHSSHRLVGVVGLDNVAIVETADAVLVADINQSQSVKEIVDQLAQQEREERLLHRKVFRPWGWYDTIDIGERFKVKRIQVNPGASLSLQKHAKRAEHWVIVKGEAKVDCGNNSMILNENESTYIPVGQVHRLSNLTEMPLEIIEVQSGPYLGEDDIIRLDDHYGRLGDDN